MKRFAFLFLFPLFSNAQASRGGMPQLVTPVPFAGYEFLNRKSVYSHADLIEEGTFLFPQQASFATVKLKNGRTYTHIKAMINLLDNELLFQDSTGQNYTAIVPIDLVEFEKSENNANKATFKCGLSPVDGFTENTFYEVLADGKLTLLKARKVAYTDKTSITSSVPIRRYDTQEILYVYDKTKGLRKLSKNKKDILELLSDQNEEMNGYFSSRKVNPKSESDLTALFTFYNGLATPAH